MLTVLEQNRFKREVRRLARRGKNLSKLDEVVKMLANEEQLPEQYRDHALRGEWEGFRDCHIEPDWLLIYRIENEKLILVLVATGSHSDLF